MLNPNNNSNPVMLTARRWMAAFCALLLLFAFGCSAGGQIGNNQNQPISGTTAASRDPSPTEVPRTAAKALPLIYSCSDGTLFCGGPGQTPIRISENRGFNNYAGPHLPGVDSGVNYWNQVSPDGTRVLFNDGSNSDLAGCPYGTAFSLCMTALDGTCQKTVIGDVVYYRQSGDGSCFTYLTADRELWRYEPATGDREKIAEGVSEVSVSKSGEVVVYLCTNHWSSWRESRLYRKRGNADPELLTDKSVRIGAKFFVTDDGNTVVYNEEIGGSQVIIRMEGNRKREIAKGNLQKSFSDGTFYYTLDHDDTEERFELFFWNGTESVSLGRGSELLIIRRDRIQPEICFRKSDGEIAFVQGSRIEAVCRMDPAIRPSGITISPDRSCAFFYDSNHRKTVTQIVHITDLYRVELDGSSGKKPVLISEEVIDRDNIEIYKGDPVYRKWKDTEQQTCDVYVGSDRVLENVRWDMAAFLTDPEEAETLYFAVRKGADYVLSRYENKQLKVIRDSVRACYLNGEDLIILEKTGSEQDERTCLWYHDGVGSLISSDSKYIIEFAHDSQ